MQNLSSLVKQANLSLQEVVQDQSYQVKLENNQYVVYYENNKIASNESFSDVVFSSIVHQDENNLNLLGDI